MILEEITSAALSPIFLAFTMKKLASIDLIFAAEKRQQLFIRYEVPPSDIFIFKFSPFLCSASARHLFKFFCFSFPAWSLVRGSSTRRKQRRLSECSRTSVSNYGRCIPLEKCQRHERQTVNAGRIISRNVGEVGGVIVDDPIGTIW